MADAQLMEEELQHSVMISEGDAPYDEPSDVDMDTANDGSFPKDGLDDVNSSVDEGDEDELDGDEESSDGDGDDDDNNSDEEEDEEDADGGDDDAFEEDDEEDDEEEDGDEDEALGISTKRTIPTIEEQDNETSADEDDEGVGAVKIKPGETDEEDDSDDSASSASASSAESEAWEAAAEQEEEEEDEEEESDNAQSNSCLFCKRDADNDAGEDVEAIITCTACGENGSSLPLIYLSLKPQKEARKTNTPIAHQDCAREAKSLGSEHSQYFLPSRDEYMDRAYST